MMHRLFGNKLQPRDCGIVLAVIVVFAIILRIMAVIVLDQPLESDPFAYFIMAQSLVDQGKLLDNYGQHAFYSAGYPLLIAPFFLLLGSNVSIALMVNMLLAVVDIWLIYKLTHILADFRKAGLLASCVYAVWLPSIWNASTLAKENLSTPLLLAITLCAVLIARGQRPLTLALVAGVLWGASLITGGSALLLCAGIGVALALLWRAFGRFKQAFGAGLCFCIGAIIILAPWLYSTNEMVGRPVLTTNAAFNLYLGNNPAATGRFVSIADTPMGPDWNRTRQRLGEIGNADRLQDEALRWIGENPAESGELALRKLVYFWQPNFPDATDFAESKIVSTIRLFDVAQYLTILVLGLGAFCTRHVDRGDKWIIAAMITSFWLIHTAAYIIPRYRDPAVPLFIVLASIFLVSWFGRRGEPQDLRRAT